MSRVQCYRLGKRLAKRQIPFLEGNNNKSTFFASGPFMLSDYRALLGEFSFDQKEALDILKQITNFKVRKKFENLSLLMKFIFPRVAKYEFLRDLAMKKMTYKEEKYGWRPFSRSLTPIWQLII